MRGEVCVGADADCGKKSVCDVYLDGRGIGGGGGGGGGGRESSDLNACDDKEDVRDGRPREGMPASHSTRSLTRSPLSIGVNRIHI